MDNSLSTLQKKTAYRILIVIDTAAIKSNYFNKDIDLEEPIKIEQANWFSISQKKNPKAINTLHTASVDSKRNDKIIISGISIDGDSSDAIILNQILIKKKDIDFEAVCLTKKTVSNNDNSENGLPAINTEQNVIWFESIVSHPGKYKIIIYFSLYYLNSDGNQQDLYGRFWFPLEINIL